MFVHVKNENYGKTTATYGDYVTVASPANLRWDYATASMFYTGSVDIFRYNKNTDQHDYVNTIYQNKEEFDVILDTETPDDIITESSSLSPSYNTASILIDKDMYIASVDDGFGTSLDMYEKLLIVGTPYFKQVVMTDTSLVVSASGATVEVHDFARTEFIPLSQSSYVVSLVNPDLDITESFGKGVSINNSWIAVGSPYVSSSRGTVYMYKNMSTGSNYSWSFYQTIKPTNSLTNALFGWDLKLDKKIGAISQSIVVGCGNSSNGKAYYFEFVDGSWTQTYEFVATRDILPLTFGGYIPYQPTMSYSSGFGSAVSTYDNTVVIGAPLDRTVYEYSGSSLYQQGSVYVFEKCQNLPYIKFNLALKTYGNLRTLKNNRLGYSVDIFGKNIVAGIPKVNNESMSTCYLEGTLNQIHDCEGNLESILCGQTMFLQPNTSSLDWEITNVYQKKKRYLSPYRAFGDDVSIADRSIVVGAPMSISNTSRDINIETTHSNNTDLGDISGKAYIYNLKNLREEFHVGNVFYRNGKVIVMTSGSAFDQLCYNPINTRTYEYDLQFKGQHTIFEKQVICSVDPGEFNISTNPSAIVKLTSSFDVNKNGRFDFQDVDVLLRYMQYKNTSVLGAMVSTDWSSSVVVTDDEISLLNYYQSADSYNNEQTSYLTSESIVRWEMTDTWMQDVLDLNDDNRIDMLDIRILWKYFSNRLTQENYATYITPSCKKKLLSDVVDYLDVTSQRTPIPYIKTDFLNYESSSASDRTGSYLRPFATAVGLYSGLDLVCTAKLANPIKLIPEFPFNFVIRLDF